MRRAMRIMVMPVLIALLAACTPTPVATPIPATAATMPTAAPSATAALVPSPTVAPSATATQAPSATPATVQVTVYLTDETRYATGTPPFEAEVTRAVPAGSSLPEAVLDEFFKGPTAEERARGLAAIKSGFTGYSELTVQDGIAHVRLAGPCASNGATYTIAQPLIKNLCQFPEIQYVKIYDADGVTTQPSGPTSSIPPCLEP